MEKTNIEIRKEAYETLINRIRQNGCEDFINQNEFNTLISNGAKILFSWSDEGEYQGLVNHDIKTSEGLNIRIHI